MTTQEIGLLLISILASALGQVFLKLGALKLGRVTADNVINHVLAMISIPELIVGLSAYGIGAIAYILLLTRVKLSIAGPSASLVYVISVMCGYFIFKETLSIERIVGLGFILCGVILVASR